LIFTLIFVFEILMTSLSLISYLFYFSRLSRQLSDHMECQVPCYDAWSTSPSTMNQLGNLNKILHCIEATVELWIRTSQSDLLPTVKVAY